MAPLVSTLFVLIRGLSGSILYAPSIISRRDWVIDSSGSHFASGETQILNDPTLHLGHFTQILAANYAFFRVEISTPCASPNG